MVRVSDHALLRFIERTLEVDVEVMRTQIASACDRHQGAPCVKAGGSRFLIRKGVVVTTLRDVTAKTDIPAPVRPFADVLGLDEAVDFLLEFGGETIYLARDVKGNSEVARTIGLDKARALTARLLETTEHSYTRIPIAKKFIARYLRSERRMPIGKIARRLHVRDATIRNWLPPSGEQMTLL